MASKLLALIVFFTIAAGGSQMAKAQSVDFSCPKAGTVEVRDTWQTRRYLGTSNDDPYVCKVMDPWGKVHSWLFNYWQVDDQFKGEGPRKAFIALLSGSQKTVTYEYEHPVSRQLNHTTWTFLRHETLTVEGKPFDTMVFSIFNRNNWGWWYNTTRWFDPKDGLWMKNELGLLHGAIRGAPGFKDVSVTFPQ